MDIRELFEQNIIAVAKQPNNNNFNLEDLTKFNFLFIPIDHDYPGGSAAMHNAVFEKFLPNYKTVFIVADPKNSKLIFETFKSDNSYCGGGVGSGFKSKAIDYVDELDDSAKITGSINVIKKENDKLIGYNTDGIGFLRGLTIEYPHSVKGKKIVILGAGGTTLPIAYELSRANPKQITIINRTISKAKHIADTLSRYTQTNYGGEEDIANYLSSADLVINTSNKGADPFKEYSAFAPILDDPKESEKIAKSNISKLPSGAIVADILLEDLSKTLELAQREGCKTHNGKSMNLYQAIPALKLMVPLNNINDYELEQIMSDAI